MTTNRIRMRCEWRCASIALCVLAVFPVAARAGEVADRWFTDLTQATPTSAIRRDGAESSWIAVDYELADRVGVMLFATPKTKSPPLTLDLKATGWHKIYFGVYYGYGPGGLENRMLTARLTDDHAVTRFGREHFRAKDGTYPERESDWTEVIEVFWKCADLTGQKLTFSPPASGTMAEWNTNLTFVRIVPMGEDDLAEWRAEAPRPETKILIANYDGGNLPHWGITTPQGFLAEFEGLRDSDFAIALYAMARGPVTFYPSKVGELIRPTGAHGGGSWYRRAMDAGLDPLEEAIRAAHTVGLKLFPQNRLQGPQLPPSHLRADYGGRFMAEHPEWMCTYGDDEPTRHLSFAYRGVRDLHLKIFREWVEDYRADGINLLFSRSAPFVYFEKPVRDAFQAKYGEDMSKLPVSDVRTQNMRAKFLTEFLAEARSVLDEVGAAQNRRIETCYTVPVHQSPPNIPPEAKESSLAELTFNALDVATWMKEGLVDHLVVHIHMYGLHDGTTVHGKIRELTDLARGTGTKVYIDIYPRRMPPYQYHKIATSYYAAGADGLSFWDTYGRYFRASEWAFVKRLGHRAELPGWADKGKDYYRRLQLKRLDGILFGREFSRPTDG